MSQKHVDSLQVFIVLDALDDTLNLSADGSVTETDLQQIIDSGQGDVAIVDELIIDDSFSMNAERYDTAKKILAMWRSLEDVPDYITGEVISAYDEHAGIENLQQFETILVAEDSTSEALAQSVLDHGRIFNGLHEVSNSDVLISALNLPSLGDSLSYMNSIEVFDRFIGLKKG